MSDILYSPHGTYKKTNQLYSDYMYIPTYIDSIQRYSNKTETKQAEIVINLNIKVIQ